MSDTERDFIFGEPLKRNLGNLMISLAFEDFYGSEEALSEVEKYLAILGKPLPRDYAKLERCIAELAIPALTAQAQDLYEKQEYVLALATLEYLQEFCIKLQAPLPELAGDLVAEIAMQELPDIPEKYRGEKIFAFFKMPDGLCQHGIYTSPARAYNTINHSDARCIGVFAGVNDAFISEAIMRTQYLTYHYVDKVELSDIIRE